MTRDELYALITRHLGASFEDDLVSMNQDADLFEMGLDSMAAFFLLDDLAQQGVQLEFTDFVAHPTPAFLVKALER